MTQMNPYDPDVQKPTGYIPPSKDQHSKSPVLPGGLLLHNRQALGRRNRAWLASIAFAVLLVGGGGYVVMDTANDFVDFTSDGNGFEFSYESGGNKARTYWDGEARLVDVHFEKSTDFPDSELGEYYAIVVLPAHQETGTENKIRITKNCNMVLEERLSKNSADPIFVTVDYLYGECGK